MRAARHPQHACPPTRLSPLPRRRGPAAPPPGSAPRWPPSRRPARRAARAGSPPGAQPPAPRPAWQWVVREGAARRERGGGWARPRTLAGAREPPRSRSTRRQRRSSSLRAPARQPRRPSQRLPRRHPSHPGAAHLAAVALASVLVPSSRPVRMSMAPPALRKGSISARASDSAEPSTRRGCRPPRSSRRR